MGTSGVRLEKISAMWNYEINWVAILSYANQDVLEFEAAGPPSYIQVHFLISMGGVPKTDHLDILSVYWLMHVSIRVQYSLDFS